MFNVKAKVKEKGSKREQAADHFIDLIDGVISEKTETSHKEMYKPAKEELKIREEGEEEPKEISEEIPSEEGEVKSEEKPKEEDEEDFLGQFLKKYKK